MILTNVELLTFSIGTALPLLTGLVTRVNGPTWLKPVVHLLLSVTTSFLVALLNAITTHVPFNAANMLITGVTTFVMGVGVYFGLMKGTGVAAAVATSTSGFIGPKNPPADTAK